MEGKETGQFVLIPSERCSSPPVLAERPDGLDRKRILIAGGLTMSLLIGLIFGLSLPAHRNSFSGNSTNSIQNATVPHFIRASLVSLDMTCGGTQGYFCPQSLPCCSQYGWCGVTAEHCGSRTQALFAYAASLPSTLPPSSSSLTLTPVNLTPDESCGGANKYTCGKGNPCCSLYGWCGSTANYCGSGTQALFAYGGDPSPATPKNPSAPPSSGSTGTNAINVDPNGTCGGSQKFSCAQSLPCCSQYGWCGVTDGHCGSGTQALFAYAASVPSATNPPAVQNNGLTYIPNNLPMIGSNAQCGPRSGRQCGASACCSRLGYCGSSASYCSLGCQAGYGACFTIKPPAAPSIDSSRSAPTFTRCKKPGVIALTFDDGEYIYTRQLLDWLRSRQIKASFFINGANSADMTVSPYPEILKIMYNDGHFIGSHTYNHLDLTTLYDQDVFEQFYQNDQIINQIIGVSPTYVRAPYGNINQRVLAAIGSWGYKGSVLWNVDTHDSDSPNGNGNLELGKQAYINALRNANPATDSFIVLQHDPIRITVEQLIPWVVDIYVPSLNRGWKFVSMDECLGISDQYK